MGFADEEAPETQYGFWEAKKKLCKPALRLLGFLHLGLTEASERCSDIKTYRGSLPGITYSSRTPMWISTPSHTVRGVRERGLQGNGIA
jgi:hypothetical protein